MFLDKLEMDSNDWFTQYLAGLSCWHRNFLFLLQFSLNKSLADHVVVGWVVDTEGSGRVIWSSYRH